MSSLARILRESRKRQRLTQAELASTLGVSQATVSRWELNQQTPDFDSMIKLSHIMGFDPVKLSMTYEQREHPYAARIMYAQEVRVVGGIQPGKWIEKPEWEEGDQFDLGIPPLNGWDDFLIEGFVVQDNTSAPVFAKDSIVFCASYNMDELTLATNDIIVITRQDDRGLFEVSLRLVHITKAGKLLLLSPNEDRQFDEILQLVHFKDPLSEANMASIEHSSVRGVVVASYRLEEAGLRRGDISKSA